ncbi:19700_t:CDS:2, partial [Gigaspora rosea]
MPREQNKGPCKVKDCNNDDITQPDRNSKKRKSEEFITNKKIHEIFTLSEIITDEWKDIIIDIVDDE